MPMGIPYSTYATVSSAEDDNYRFVSDMFPGDERVMAPNHRSAKTGSWSDYPMGFLYELQELGVELPPFTLKLCGNVPFGAGLSSSASLEVATAVALLALTENEAVSARNSAAVPEGGKPLCRLAVRHHGLVRKCRRSERLCSAAAYANTEVRVVAAQPWQPCGLPRCHSEQRDQALHLQSWRLRITQARRRRRPEHRACPVRRERSGRDLHGSTGRMSRRHEHRGLQTLLPHRERKCTHATLPKRCTPAILSAWVKPCLIHTSANVMEII